MVRNPENSVRIIIRKTQSGRERGGEKGCYSYLLGHAGDGGSVVFEVTPHQVAGSQGGHQTELASQHSAGHHAGQLGSVLACGQGM